MRASIAAVALLSTACSVGGGDLDAGTEPPDAGLDAQRPPTPDAGPPVDAWVDPFAPDGSCGFATIETERLPGSLLFVFDRSGSMDAPPVSGGTGPRRWTIAGEAVEAVLDATPDEVAVGMLLFPAADQSMCNVALTATVPQVLVAPLASSRAPIAAELATVPDGMATPIFGALRAGWDYLDMLGARGERGLVLVTDGAENCADDLRDDVLAQATTERTVDGHLTFAIGLTHTDRDLSTLALNGGTPRSPTCLADCTTAPCILDADVPCPDSGAACTTFPESESGGRAPGFCGCITSDDCPPPMTCETVDGTSSCVGVPNCCHYVAGEESFETDFRAALEAITERIADACIFDLPRGDDPGRFDPTQVNVRATFEGADPEALRRASDASVDSWDYTSDAHETIVIQGPICDRLRAETATVEIVLGCPTDLI